MEVLTAFCVMPEGYGLVIDAFDFYKKMKHQKDKFAVLMEGCGKDSPLPYQVFLYAKVFDFTSALL